MLNMHIGGPVYGLHNIGDEAILESMLTTFSESYNISVTTYDSEWIKSCYPHTELKPFTDMYVRPKLGGFIQPRRKIITNYFKIKQEVDYFKQKDFYFCGGGTILSDCPWHALRTIELAGKAHTPSIIWGAGMADGCDEMTKRYITSVCNCSYVKHIFLRDEFVKQRLVEIGVLPQKITVIYDPAIILEGEPFELKKYLTEYQIDRYKDKKKNICISISGEADIQNRISIFQLQNTISLLTEKLNCNVFLIPTGCGEHCLDREILSKIAINKNAMYINKEFSPRHLIEFLKNVNLVYSSRLHLAIFAACVNTPSVAILRNSKNKDFAKLTNQPILELEEFTDKNIEQLSNSMLYAEQELRENLSVQVNRMRNKYKKGLLQVEDLLISKKM